MENGERKFKRKQFTKSFRESIFERDNYECQRCYKNLIYLPDERVIDHKIPLSKGGSNSFNNLWLLCDDCDKRKRDNIDDDLAQEYKKAKDNYIDRVKPIRINKSGNSNKENL